MSRWMAWTIGVALVVAAWGIIQVTPSQDDAEAPFPLAAEIDETTSARGFVVTVTDVRLASRAVAGGWSAEGTWLVVDLRAEATQEETGTILAHAELVIEGAAYRASERPASLLRSGLTPGIPREGSLAFELPSDVVRDTATLELGISDDPRLDSLVTLPIDLGALEAEDEVELVETGWAER
ncbi:hypothetical protein QSU92_17280 [Microbacterium sp. ET2]|uniref:hypothetical protein n=1 Tax=Microbacterium albipurpureum TaxID=3050384 RepID=UPI00259CE1EB|nr:hypothetical protein [Microbacterium sp. ET2 (Ac-2212)]WJL95638.1 hypothetical protein QSU92_17280 [Microbacterium sp. ET2 (Ac-2212)]